MAVYTQLNTDDVAAFLSTYRLGRPTAVAGILKGVENSNYHLTTDHGRFILTVFEKRTNEADLPFFFALTDHLAQKHFHCPAPQKNNSGQIINRLKNKPAAVVSFLPGVEKTNWDKDDCYAVGDILAQLHIHTADFYQERINQLSVDGWATLLTHCSRALHHHDAKHKIIGDQLEALNTTLAQLQQNWPSRDSLPRGICHADLFPDNVFFDDATSHSISGVIDFYFACTDHLAYDLAITLTAWCFSATTTEPVARLRPDLASSLLAGYQSRRPLTMAEKKYFPLLTVGAALRFTLTRLYDQLHHNPDHQVVVKDPQFYWSILRQLQSPQGQKILTKLLAETTPS
ncbi:MAG: homoserine kinase [Alphaproteobacteria bacterium]|nr:homoserine kinase [Alphaproteobacteria bacterium]